MSFQRILCPVDLSGFSEQAIRVASSIARADGGTLHFLYVAMPELPLSAAGAVPDVNAHLKMEEAKLQLIRPVNGEVPFVNHFIRGEPVQVIVDFVKEHGIDLVVMPTHGRTGLLRLLMGSVTEKVVRLAPCPVLVVKSPEVDNKAAAE
ncbi:MAG: universal stress protein [Pirellulaceae bacterium]|jgi:nucleotide-binding universal stress UspA family protein|nr:universal stress protein [Pirellulaceae bacterium]